MTGLAKQIRPRTLAPQRRSRSKVEPSGEFEEHYIDSNSGPCCALCPLTMDDGEDMAGEEFAEADLGDFDDFPEEEADPNDEESEDEEEDPAEAQDISAEDLEDDLSPYGDIGENVAGKKRTKVLSDPEKLLKGQAPDEIRVLPEDQHMTPDFITDYELGRILSVRAEQIDRSNEVFLPKGVSRPMKPVARAKLELMSGMCPLILQRVRSHGGNLVIEEHLVRELRLINPL